MANIKRTWEFASKLLKNQEDLDLITKDILIGTLSAGIAHEFFAYMSYCSELPKIQDIIKRPEEVEIPEEPALLFAISHMLAAYMNIDNADRIIRYVDRLPLDFGVTAIRSTLKRKPSLLSEVNSIRAWAHKLADEVF